MSLILAVDDDKNLLKMLTKQIEVIGHKIITASSGIEGIEFARSGNPDLILLDIMMPDMNGFDVIKKIKKDEIIKKIPIIMITSKTGKEYVIEAMRQGVLDYIVKPYNFTNLSKKIESAIKQGSIVKTREELNRTEFILVTRDSGITSMTFLSNLSNPGLIADAKKIIHPSFLKLIANDIKLIDIRGLNEFKSSDVLILNGIISLFNSEDIHVVAGKHYGELVAASDIEERVRVYISYGDFEVFINQK
jgi:twitching motility two-component system response regulator PilH